MHENAKFVEKKYIFQKFFSVSRIFPDFFWIYDVVNVINTMQKANYEAAIHVVHHSIWEPHIK